MQRELCPKWVGEGGVVGSPQCIPLCPFSLVDMIFIFLSRPHLAEDLKV